MTAILDTATAGPAVSTVTLPALHDATTFTVPYPAPPKPRTIALLGRSQSTRDEVPLDGSVEVWGLNRPGIAIAPEQVSAWFELHNPGIWRGSPNAETYIAWLRSIPAGTPVYMREHHEDIPASVPYPFERVYAAFPRRYFTSTMAYMLALAILDLEGTPNPTVMTFGIDMAGDGEYAYQRACFEYYLGQAEGRGIRVVLPEACQVLRGLLYGWADAENPFRTRISMQVELRRRYVFNERGQTAADLNQVRGEIMAVANHCTDEKKAALLPGLKERERALELKLERLQGTLEFIAWVHAQTDDLRDLVREHPGLERLLKQERT